MDTKDDPIDGEDADPDEVILHGTSRNRGGEDEGENMSDSEDLRRGTEMIVKAIGHRRMASRCFPISLGDPENRGGHGGSKRPNDWAIVIFENESLEARTRAFSVAVIETIDA